VATEIARRPPIDAAYLRTLRRAVEIAGGEAALAVAWSVARDQLARWLAGELILPVSYYMLALKIVHSQGEEWRTAGSH
jgi:hypothetical protein